MYGMDIEEKNSYEENWRLVSLAIAISHCGHLATIDPVKHHLDVAWRSQPQK